MVSVTIPLFGKTLGHTLDRIALGPKAGGLGPIQNSADSLANTAGSFGLGEPDRSEDFKDITAADLVDALWADDGKGVVLECGEPLCGMLGVLPPRCMLTMNGFGGCLEGWYGLLLASICKGITTLARDLTIGQGFFACFGERYQTRPTQTNVATSALHDDTQDPASSA